MRTVLAAALLLLLVPSGQAAWLGSGTAEAQSRHGHASAAAPAEPFRPSIGLPLPQIGLPLPPIGLPLPPLGLPPQQHQPDRSQSFRRSPGVDHLKRFDGSHRIDRRGTLGIPLFGLSYPYVPDLSATPTIAPPTEAAVPEAIGGLRLDLQRGIDPRIFVDGYYVGLLSDANGVLALRAGRHAVEFQQDGYEPLRVDVDIPSDEEITYRGELRRIVPKSHIEPPPAPLPPPPPAPSTIYVIPGCYIGNVAPRDAALPTGCNLNGTVTIPPNR